MNEVEQAQFLRGWKEKLQRPAWKEFINLTAQEKFAQFQAYRGAGFDAKQALELVIREGGKP
jgi:hypothetical protein